MSARSRSWWAGAAVLTAEVALVLAALCALAAVRVPRHRSRRLVRSRRFRRAAVGAAAGGLLCFLPAADLGSGPVTGLDTCGPGEPVPFRGEAAFLCNARRTFPTMPDHGDLPWAASGRGQGLGQGRRDRLRQPPGDAVLGAAMSGPGTTSDLAFLGRGHYRLRVHYRELDRDLPQHILVMAFPGRSERVIAHRR